MIITRRRLIAGLATCGVCLATAAGLRYMREEEFITLCDLSNGLSSSKVENLRPAKPEALHMVSWICDQIGVEPNFEVLEGDFLTGSIAFAAVRGDQRYIVYDAKWFRFEPGTVDWYMVWIFAHEIGHHIHSHTTGVSESRHAGELAADRFGGWVVARLGGSQEDALSFMPRLPVGSTDTHPARDLRIEASTNGWQAGRSLEISGPEQNLQFITEK